MDVPQAVTAEAPRRTVKSEAAFRTISEVSEDLDVPQHVLRFWESKFPQIKPLKRGGGRRYYRPEDVALLRRIRDLLYKDGYTIRGVQKLLREQTGRTAGAAPILEPNTAEPLQMEASFLVVSPEPAPVPSAAPLAEPIAEPEPLATFEPIAVVVAEPALVVRAPEPLPAVIAEPVGLGSEERAELGTLLGELESLRDLLSQARAATVR